LTGNARPKHVLVAVAGVAVPWQVAKFQVFYGYRLEILRPDPAPGRLFSSGLPHESAWRSINVGTTFNSWSHRTGPTAENVRAQLNDDGRPRESRENIDIFAPIEEAEDGHLSLIRTVVSAWVKFVREQDLLLNKLWLTGKRFCGPQVQESASGAILRVVEEHETTGLSPTRKIGYRLLGADPPIINGSSRPHTHTHTHTHTHENILKLSRRGQGHRNATAQCRTLRIPVCEVGLALKKLLLERVNWRRIAIDDARQPESLQEA
jgi:hypothetical protein